MDGLNKLPSRYFLRKDDSLKSSTKMSSVGTSLGSFQEVSDPTVTSSSATSDPAVNQ